MVRCRVLSLADAGVRRSRGQGRSCGDGCTVAEGGAQSLTTTLHKALFWRGWVSIAAGDSTYRVRRGREPARRVMGSGGVLSLRIRAAGLAAEAGVRPRTRAGQVVRERLRGG